MCRDVCRRPLCAVRSMCLFLQNQDFQIHAEHMLDALYDGGKEAAARLLLVNASMAQQVLFENALEHCGPLRTLPHGGCLDD